MEVISSFKYFSPLFCICVAFIVIGIIVVLCAIYKEDPSKKDKIVDTLYAVGEITIFVALIIMIIFAKKPVKYYRLRIDDNITISEFKNEYRIINYDEKTDLWIVDIKSDKENKEN